MTETEKVKAAWVWNAGNEVNPEDDDDEHWDSPASSCNDEAVQVAINDVLTQFTEEQGSEIGDCVLKEEVVKDIVDNSIHVALERAREKVYENSTTSNSNTSPNCSSSRKQQVVPKAIRNEDLAIRARQAFYKRTQELNQKMNRRSVLDQSMSHILGEDPAANNTINADEKRKISRASRAA